MALNNHQIDTIQLYLEGLITDEQKSITPKRIFNKVKGLIDLDYDKFVLALTYLFKSERIPGYVFLTDGYICNKENISVKPKVIDGLFKPKLKREILNINGENFIVMASKDFITKVLRDIFHAKEISDGKIVIGDLHFDCSDTEVFSRFLGSFYGMKKEV